ncbi:tissue inhibitor of metalloproteinase domain-containing protein [Ditylenchus destructor]|uniref:Tissue inhibitor of metalloproteinase domain-containing protein n=1 Tax=Ditylenchus destructor TaxID=166010 RepID=A0AAD4RAK2_9BILA|nr:tissue inhibitor of metalloproteinase domain-containing protein [Ditylenchus destructor]
MESNEGDEELECFQPMLEELRQQICEGEIKSETDLEQIVTLISTIGIDQLNFDDIDSTLNVILKYIKTHTEKFPSTVLLDYIRRCLVHVSQSERRRVSKTQIFSMSWPSDLRLVVRRLLQTFKIPEEYLVFSFELCSLASQALGSPWLLSDTQFAVLIASLSSGRLRIVLQDPSDIPIQQLIHNLSLLEDLIRCVEEDESDSLDENSATSMSRSAQEAASFICEAIAKLAETMNVTTKMDYFLVLYRFICVFLSVGGAKIIDPQTLGAALPTLMRVCKFCINQRDADTAALLIMNLPEFEKLTESSMEIVLDYARLALPTPQSKEVLVQLTTLFDQLKDKKGWYSETSISEAENFATTVGDQRISDLISYIKINTANSCSCIPITRKEAICESQWISLANVLGKNETIDDFRFTQYIVEHIKVFKSSIGDDLPTNVRTPRFASACGIIDLKMGKQYVLSGSFSDANSLLIFSCGAIPAQDGCEMNTQQLKN